MALISRSAHTVPVTVQARTAVDPATAFEVVVPIDLSVVFRGCFPGVRGVSNQSGRGTTSEPPGTLTSPMGRRPPRSLTEYDPGHSFAYELTEFTNVLGRLVSGVRGEWTVTPDGPGALIRWIYEFVPRAACYAPVRVGLAPLWQRYMLSGLAETVAAVERAAS